MAGHPCLGRKLGGDPVSKGLAGRVGLGRKARPADNGETASLRRSVPPFRSFKGEPNEDRGLSVPAVKVYVASSWRNERQPEVVKALEEAGHEVYDFRHPHMGPGARGVGFHWSEIDPDWTRWTTAQFRDALEDQRALDGCASDLAGMAWADVILLVMPCGRSAHLELGWGIGFGKVTMILLSDGEPELMYRLAHHLCLDVDEVLRKIAWHEDRGT